MCVAAHTNPISEYVHCMHYSFNLPRGASRDFPENAKRDGMQVL